MASFRIHEDRENLHVGTRAKDVFPQKRSVLGAISTNNFDSNARVPGKQVLQVHKQDSENYQPKKNVSKVPVVPVAQFEAFSVYEGAAENKKKNQKAHVLPTENIDKTKVLSKIVPKEVEEKVAPKSPEDKELLKDSPMSIDRSLLANIENKPVLEKPRIQRDIIYDITDYRDDIYKYLRECETKHRPKAGYMAKQPDITYSMRTVLVDWLVEVAEEYKLQGETLFLAVSYIDRFLSYMSVVRAKLQLVGTAAMFVAAKYEEIYPPDVGEFVYITDDTYSKKQVLRMEHLILKVLSFDLSVPTSLTFVKEFCTTFNLDEKVTNLSMYLIELALLEADPYLKLLPSQIACGAIALARYTLEQEPWTTEYEKSTGYSFDSLRPCITHLESTFSKATTLEQQAIQEKYKQAKHHHVALILPKEPIPELLYLSLYSESKVSTIDETS